MFDLYTDWFNKVKERKFIQYKKKTDEYLYMYTSW